MQYYLYVVALLFGLAIGSFLNVVIYRLPRHESLVRPGSHCPKCESAIRWYDNLPVISWLVLRGQCRDCGARISPRYIGVEALTGALFVLAMWRLDLTWTLLVAVAFISALVAIAFIDYDHMIIPDAIVLPGAVIGLAASIALEPDRWWVYLVAGFGGAVFCFALAMLWPGGGMGFGDVKMALFIGFVLGTSVIVAFFLAFLVGSIVGVYLVVVRKRSGKSKLPFGPFLAFGSVVAILAGELLLSLYQSTYN
ncbi:MAG: prepilin peptidase [Thermoleophilia bacterium]|nr:prepilin peptidase [Thermoleophilia bacterium]